MTTKPIFRLGQAGAREEPAGPEEEEARVQVPTLEAVHIRQPVILLQLGYPILLPHKLQVSLKDLFKEN